MIREQETNMSEGLLYGLKVVEFGDFIAVPYCGKLLADLGADVIKIEKPGLGDKSRSWGPFPSDIPHIEKSGLFMFLNTNKLGITLNVKSTLGLKILKELIKNADIFVLSSSYQEIEELGLNFGVLHELNPGLIMTSITPFGTTGPYRDYRGNELISANMSGIAYVNPAGGVEDIKHYAPLKSPYHSSDFMTGLTAAVVTMFAVIGRQATGLGQNIDLSHQEALVSTMRSLLAGYASESILRSRKKSDEKLVAPLYPCKDGYVCMNILAGSSWKSMQEIMGNPEWMKDERFQDPNYRRQNMGECFRHISDWTRQHTAEEINDLARSKRVPCSPVYDVDDFVNAEQILARDFFIEVEHPEAGKYKYPGAPYKFSANPWIIRRAAPLLGEQNEQVYYQMGYTKQDMVKMRQAGVI
jgi:crotonobetainyl-CoA:carnitine CoA-transferase CaiB-like acyl-CoA transferase